jgi:hypothetical protein
MLGSDTIDAVFNLTPAPYHGGVNRDVLEAEWPVSARSRWPRPSPTPTR